MRRACTNYLSGVQEPPAAGPAVGPGHASKSSRGGWASLQEQAEALQVCT